MPRAALRRAAACGVLALLGAVAPMWPTGAGAADHAELTARLSLTGLVSTSSPLGGALMWVHPGDTVDFRAGTLFAMDGLNLGDLLGYHVMFDAGGLPGGRQSVWLGTSSSYALTFPKAGVYSLNWQAASLLGPLSLDANQLRSLGLSVNASLQWSAQIVVTASNSPTALSLALPQISVHPNLLIVGRLPAITVPAIVLNQARVTTGSGSGGGSGGGFGGSGTAQSGPAPTGHPSQAPATTGVRPPAGVSRALDSTPSAPGSTGGSLSQPPPRPHAPPLAAPFPQSSFDTFAVDGLIGFLILGGMWILWVVSVRPILGR
ncbi:MAG: hypothetical protein M3N95_14200 [Actinomycetota bacterium]|nr:hypothetical protein [Actinomycetota bacterium]